MFDVDKYVDKAKVNIDVKSIGKPLLNNILTFMVKDGEILRHFIDNQELTQVKIYTDLGMSKQNFHGLFKSQVLEQKTKDRFEAYFKKKIFTKEAAKALHHIKERNELKKIGELKNGIQVYETSPVQAGIRTVYHDEHIVPDYVLTIPQFRDCNYGTRASGDSMYPEVRNGDLVFCKELPVNARIIYGDMYVIHTQDGIETIKYIKQFVDNENGEAWVLLVPHNKEAGMGTPIPRKEIVKLFKVRAIFKGF